MTEAKEVQRYIQSNDWDLEFNGRTVENLFRTEYSVSFVCTDGYADLSNVRYGTKEITIKQPCKLEQDLFGHIEGTEYVSYALAHEVGHTETYALGTGLALVILGIGMKNAIQQKDLRAFAKGAGAALVTKFFIDEFSAEVSAQLLHGASVHTNTPQWYQTLLNLL